MTGTPPRAAKDKGAKNAANRPAARGAGGSRRRPATAPGGVADGAARASQPVDEQVAARLRVAVTRLHRRLRQESFTGISPSQEAVLAAISRLGRPTLGELAQVERVQPPTMTRVIAAMEQAGLVSRLSDAADRRVCRVELTRPGRTALDRIRSLKTAYLARRLGQLTPDERELAARLASLLEELVEDR